MINTNNNLKQKHVCNFKIHQIPSNRILHTNNYSTYIKWQLGRVVGCGTLVIGIVVRLLVRLYLHSY